MRLFIATIGMLFIALFSWDSPASAANCSCAALMPTIEACWVADWHALKIPLPETRDELEALLDSLMSGTDSGAKCIMKSGCFESTDAMDTQLEKCTPQVWARLADLLDRTDDRVTKLGAMTLVYGAYMDIGPPRDVESRLVATAERILTREKDPLILASLCKMLEPYQFARPSVMKLMLKQMASHSPLVRELAFDTFKQYSNTPLPFESSGPEQVRSRQLAELEAWWSAHEPEKRGQ